VEATRARIVAAAAKEFAAHGYAGARTVRIAERAGLTHAMLHYHFDTNARRTSRLARRGAFLGGVHGARAGFEGARDVATALDRRGQKVP